MFGSKKRLKTAFAKVGNDIEAVKGSVNDWSVYLQKNQLEFEERLQQLEQRIASIEEINEEINHKKVKAK